MAREVRWGGRKTGTPTNRQNGKKGVSRVRWLSGRALREEYFAKS